MVLFDPSRDLAVLYVPGLNLPALHVVRSAPFGGKAVARSSEKFGTRVLDKVAFGWNS